jgi:hypothetical protein
MGPFSSLAFVRARIPRLRGSAPCMYNHVFLRSGRSRACSPSSASAGVFTHARALPQREVCVAERGQLAGQISGMQARAGCGNSKPICAALFIGQPLTDRPDSPQETYVRSAGGTTSATTAPVVPKPADGVERKSRGGRVPPTAQLLIHASSPR